MIWAAMSSASVGPLCFLKCSVNTAIYQEILEHFMLPSADKLYGDAGFIFQQDLAPAHTAEGALCTALPGKQFLLTLQKWHLGAKNEFALSFRPTRKSSFPRSARTTSVRAIC